jgi:hypothetical protein
MLTEMFESLEEHFPSTARHIEQNHWDANVSLFASYLHDISEYLFGAVRAVAPERLFTESALQIAIWKTPGIGVTEVHLRPQDAYYNARRRPVPAPANPDGPHATGAKVALELFRGFSAQAIHLPMLQVQFNVWGHEEREAFHELFIQHGGLIKPLLRPVPFEFETSYVFENIEKYTGTDAFRKLSLYYQNDDGEAVFTLQRSFLKGSDIAHIIRTLLVSTALYDALLGYTQTRQDRNRILQYAWLLRP